MNGGNSRVCPVERAGSLDNRIPDGCKTLRKYWPPILKKG